PSTLHVKKRKTVVSHGDVVVMEVLVDVVLRFTGAVIGHRANVVVHIWLVQHRRLDGDVVNRLPGAIGIRNVVLISRPACAHMIKDDIVDRTAREFETNGSARGARSRGGIVRITGHITDDDIVRRNEQCFPLYVGPTQHNASSWSGLPGNG